MDIINKNKVTLQITMTEAQAEAIAQFFKRMGHDDYSLKTNHHNLTELEDMKGAGNRIRESLSKVGFDPR